MDHFLYTKFYTCDILLSVKSFCLIMQYDMYAWKRTYT